MSIAMLDVEASSLDRIRSARRPTSTRRVEANRRNARKSTGPKTSDGKRRASRNALKHGLCAMLSHLPSECGATFNTFVTELEEELRPCTVLQRIVFNEIANLTWRLQRLPEAQSKLFAEESAKARADGEDEALSASDVLARRFSDEPGGNGFGLMERYERGMRNSLLRLLRQFDQLKKHRPTTPYADGEPPCPPERAWSGADTRRQHDAVDRTARVATRAEKNRRGHLQRELEEDAARELDHVGNAASDEERKSPATEIVGATLASPASRDEQMRATQASPLQASNRAEESAASKRSQTKPTTIAVGEASAGKCTELDASPVTKRSQRDGRSFRSKSV